MITENPWWLNLTHWKSIEPLLDPSHTLGWVIGEDRVRVMAYDAYEAIYWAAPDSFKLEMRGQEGKPIYVPSGRQVIETAHQYLATGFGVITDPSFGSEGERTQAAALMMDFLRRERFLSRFSANKRGGLMKGDWLWHVFADEDREAGSRISIYQLDPSTYFPEFLEDDISVRIGAHLVESTFDRDGDPAVRKLSYVKESGQGGPSRILVSDALYATDEWGQPGTDMALGSPVQIFLEDVPLPEVIDAIPVYHIPNSYVAGDPWGSSEMRGIERLMTAVNQGITDEELTLVLEGLGVYTTDAGSPIDEEGEDTAWIVAPGHVVELPPGRTFQRVTGNQTIEPYLSHLRYLHEQIDNTIGTNDFTRGRVDVQVAESGISLFLKMAPLLSRMGEKELVVTDVHNNLLFDLRNWFIAYEGLGGLENIRWIPTYGDKLPVNRKEILDEVISLSGSTPPIISAAESRRILRKKGIELSDDAVIDGEIDSEADAVAARMAAELSLGTPPPVA